MNQYLKWGLIAFGVFGIIYAYRIYRDLMQTIITAVPGKPDVSKITTITVPLRIGLRNISSVRLDITRLIADISMNGVSIGKIAEPVKVRIPAQTTGYIDTILTINTLSLGMELVQTIINWSDGIQFYAEGYAEAYGLITIPIKQELFSYGGSEGNAT